MDLTDTSFPKKEHLCSQKLLDLTFGSGHRLMVFPFSVHWAICHKNSLPEDVTAQVLIATSKKKFHHAVDRNRVKRLMRECYRLHKCQICHPLEGTEMALLVAINYVHNHIFDYAYLYRKFDKLTDLLTAAISKELTKMGITSTADSSDKQQ